MSHRRGFVFVATFCLSSALLVGGLSNDAWAIQSEGVAAGAAPVSGGSAAVASWQTPQQAFEQGKRWMTAGRYREACRAFVASEVPAPTMSTRYHLGRCHEGLGDFEKAHELFRDAARIAARKGDKPRKKAALAKADEMKRKAKETRRAAALQRKEQERQQAARKAAEQAADEPTGPTRRRNPILFYTGIGLTAAGGVALLTASLVTAGQTCSSCAPPPGAIAGGVLGLAGIGAGVPLFLIFGKKVPVSSTAWLRPAIGPGFAELRGAF